MSNAVKKRTTIKTRIGDPGPEIVSCYSNINGRWVWETLVWDDTDILETAKSDSVNEVMKKHAQFYEKFG